MSNHETVRPQDPQQAQDPLVDSICRQLDHSCDALDGYTLSRLHRIRSEAVARRRPWLQTMLLPFGGLATAAALAVALGIGWRGDAGLNEAGSPALEDIEILAANEALDFYADYEFYQWLAQD